MNNTLLEVRDLSLDQLKPGLFVSYETVIGKEEVASFAELTGDVSPLHVSHEYGKSVPWRTNLVHGMLVGSHFSTIVGVLLPGKRALLNSMKLSFVEPIPVESSVTISGKIKSVSKATHSLQLDLLALVDGVVCVHGEALVKVRE